MKPIIAKELARRWLNEQGTEQVTEVGFENRLVHTRVFDYLDSHYTLTPKEAHQEKGEKIEWEEGDDRATTRVERNFLKLCKLLESRINSLKDNPQE